MRKYKNMIQFVTICDDFNGKLMSYDTVNIPKCAQGSILHVGSWVIIDKEICLVQKGDIWPGILQRILYTRYISSVNLTKHSAGAKLKQCHCDGEGGGGGCRSS